MPQNLHDSSELVQNNEDLEKKLLDFQKETKKTRTADILSKDQQELLLVHESCNHVIPILEI